MLEKLKGLKDRYDLLTERMAAQDAMQDMDAYRALVKEHASLEEIVAAYMEYGRLEAEIAGC
ncbi:MAG: PCRF domain-containing protein, partial [Clostridia bacterium]|nr:PCRF domain-containing protein [Clostridia bacterium]